MGALDDEVADRVVADFDLALLARQAFPTPAGRAARLQRWSAAVRFWPAVPVSSLSPGSGPVPGRLVRLGQVIPVPGEPGGEVYLLSYALTDPGHAYRVSAAGYEVQVPFLLQASVDGRHPAARCQQRARRTHADAG